MKTTFSIPFDWNLSKNRMKLYAKRHYYKNPATGILQEAIGWEIKKSGINKKLVKDKIYLEILVIKPSFRGDAINFMDAIADAVRKVINVDDCWFSANVDWKINKDDPKIWITIRQ